MQCYVQLKLASYSMFNGMLTSYSTLHGTMPEIKSNLAGMS